MRYCYWLNRNWRRSYRKWMDMHRYVVDMVRMVDMIYVRNRVNMNMIHVRNRVHMNMIHVVSRVYMNMIHVMNRVNMDMIHVSNGFSHQVGVRCNGRFQQHRSKLYRRPLEVIMEFWFVVHVPAMS